MTRLLSTTFLVAICVAFLSTIHPTSAIGGWETIHILVNRLNGKHSQQIITADETSSERRTSDLNSSNKKGSSDSSSSSSSNKKRHVGEVTMTNNKSNRGVKNVSSSSAVAFVPRGRRGRGVCSDGDDLKTIDFVRNSNPFL